MIQNIIWIKLIIKISKKKILHMNIDMIILKIVWKWKIIKMREKKIENIKKKEKKKINTKKKY